MSDPISALLEEHLDLLARIAPLRSALEGLRREGALALPAAMSALEEVAETMDTRLLRHARKEDEVLFPALEEVLGGAGPTAVMREEHRFIHERAALFRETLRQIRELEHPAIAAGGAALREAARRGGGAAELSAIGEEIVRTVDLHFAKEEEILFPMAREILSAPELAEIGRRIEAIDLEPIGRPGAR